MILATAVCIGLGIACLLWAAVAVQAVRQSRGRFRSIGRATKLPANEHSLVIVIPHRNRDDFVSVTAPAVLSYVRARHPGVRVTVLCVEQRDRAGPYAKGLSWNVAFRHLVDQGFHPDTQVILNDADIVPRDNVSFWCPPRGKGTLWFQNTGGLKTRLGDLVAANGFPMAISGWGYEDVAMWHRLERIIDVSLYHWREELDPCHPAVVLNLEWEKSAPEEEITRLQEWYWGDDVSRVRMVGQGDRDWGLERAITPPSKEGWYSEAKRMRNEEVGNRVDDLSPADFRTLTEADGLSALRAGGAVSPFHERFPSVAPDASLLNLSFDSAAVLASTPRFFLEHPKLSWYFQGPVSCETGAAAAHCSQGQVCKQSGGVCLPV